MQEFEWEGVYTNRTFLFVRPPRGDFRARIQMTVDGRKHIDLLVAVGERQAPRVDPVTGETINFPLEKPHIFLSHRRTHAEFALAIFAGLRHYGYDVFRDAEPGSLHIGEFQQQLVNKLGKSLYVLALLTPAPSGDDANRQDRSSLAAAVDAALKGRQDYVLDELRVALAAKERKMVIPVYRAAEGNTLLPEMHSLHLPPELAPLPKLMAMPVRHDDFLHSICNLHCEIQRDIQKRIDNLPDEELDEDQRKSCTIH